MRRVKVLGFALMLVLAACSSDAPTTSQEAEVADESSPHLEELTAASLTDWFACQEQLPVVDSVVYTAESDPNELLGRPGQYVGKSALLDERTDSTLDAGIDAGASLEVFDDADAAKQRYAYLEEVTSAPLLAEYHWLDGVVLLRVAQALTPEEAGEYKRVLDELPESGVPVCERQPERRQAGPKTLPDVPQAHASLFRQGIAPVFTEGEVAVVAVGPHEGMSFPVLIHNGTNVAVSRIEVTGKVVDGAGSTIASGESQSIEPNVVEPGGIAMGYVFTGEDLPTDAQLPDPAVDFEEGLGEFENILAVDVTEVTVTGGQVVGTVTNPHNVDVQGPVSVAAACFDAAGALTGVHTAFADRDRIEAGGQSSFSVRLGGDPSCDGLIVGASGFTD